MILYSCVIPYRGMVKKNTKKFVGSGKFKKAIYSPQYQNFQRDAQRYLIQKRNEVGLNKFPILGELTVYYKFGFKNRLGEADVSNLIEGPQDILQECGIIKNDKQIKSLFAEKEFNGLDFVEIIICSYQKIGIAA